MAIVIFCLCIFFLSVIRVKIVKAFIQLCDILHIPMAISIWMYSVVFLIGTVVHELSHFLTATILGLRTGPIQLLPRIHNNGIWFGSISIEKSDPFRAVLVGIAPLFTGFVILFGLQYGYSKYVLSHSLPIVGFHLPLLLFLYLIISISSHMIPSREDLVYWLPFGLLIGIVSVVWWNLDSPSLFRFYQIITNGVAFIIPIVVIATITVVCVWLIIKSCIIFFTSLRLQSRYT